MYTIEGGFYGVVEGNDGTGKSDQVELLADWMRNDLGLEVYTAHEPAGTPLSDELRTIIKNGNLERDALTNAILFLAARRTMWLQKAEPILERGGAVLTARSDMSTVVYQGYGEGVDIDILRDMTVRYMPPRYLHPDWEVLLDTDDLTRQVRIANRGELENPDTFESKGSEFQDRLRFGYREEAAFRGIEIVNATPSKETVQAELRERAKRALSVRAILL